MFGVFAVLADQFLKGNRVGILFLSSVNCDGHEIFSGNEDRSSCESRGHSRIIRRKMQCLHYCASTCTVGTLISKSKSNSQVDFGLIKALVKQKKSVHFKNVMIIYPPFEARRKGG